MYKPMTVWELKDYLSQFDDNKHVIVAADTDDCMALVDIEEVRDNNGNCQLNINLKTGV